MQTEGENLPTGPAQVVVTTVQDGVIGEVQEIYSNVDSGTFTLTLDFGGQAHTTAEFEHDEPVIHIQNELEKIVGEDNVHVSGSGTGDAPWRIEFVGELAAQDIRPITSNSSSLTITTIVEVTDAPWMSGKRSTTMATVDLSNWSSRAKGPPRFPMMRMRAPLQMP